MPACGANRETIAALSGKSEKTVSAAEAQLIHRRRCVPRWLDQNVKTVLTPRRMTAWGRSRTSAHTPRMSAFALAVLAADGLQAAPIPVIPNSWIA